RPAPHPLHPEPLHSSQRLASGPSRVNHAAADTGPRRATLRRDHGDGTRPRGKRESPDGARTAMTTLIWVVVALVLAGSVLAMAGSSLSRMTRGRALALESEGRRNAALLVKLETDPPRYLNAGYPAGMFVSNGSAILVAILAERDFGTP